MIRLSVHHSARSPLSSIFRSSLGFYRQIFRARSAGVASPVIAPTLSPQRYKAEHCLTRSRLPLLGWPDGRAVVPRDEIESRRAFPQTLTKGATMSRPYL